MIAVYILKLLSADGLFYVGSSVNIMARYARHLNELNKGIHHNSILQEGWNSNKPDYHFTMIPCASEEEARELENELLLKYKDDPKLANIGMSSVGGDNLSRNPNKLKIIESISNSVTLRVNSLSKEERSEKWGQFGKANGMYGRTHTDEVRRRLSKLNKGARVGEKNPNYGRRMTEEQKQNLRDKIAERGISGERNPFYGKTHTDETKRKLSKAKKGVLPVNSMSVNINGVTYPSAANAARQLSIPLPTLLFRIRSPNPKFSKYLFSN